MASLADMAKKRKGQLAPSNPKTGREEEDIRMMLMLGVKLLEKGEGLATIGTALQQSADPAQVVGQVLSQIMMTLAEQGAKELQVNPDIFLAKGGWLEGMLDYIESSLDLPKEFSDQVFGAVVEIVKASVQAAQRGEQQPQQPVGGTGETNVMGGQMQQQAAVGQPSGGVM